VRGLVFYDENANGKLDAAEEVRLPAVTVTIGGRSGSTGADGRFELASVPGGAQPAQLVEGSLPAYFGPGFSPSVPVPPPDGFELALGATLPIGPNEPNLYLAFGDSITVGDGSRGRRGYRSELASLLRSYFGRAEIVNDGQESTDSVQGADRIRASLAEERPAYTLIHYGTNDWNGFGCRHVCGTAENLRRIVHACRAASSLPVLATLIPVNPAYEDRLASARNAWIEATNTEIRAMAEAEGVVLADLHAAFVAADPDLVSLFSDHVHPNDRGYSIMAEGFFRALTAPRGR
jgi:lysophospholipase L1-like esterase